MEEAAQILEIETFIPLLLQVNMFVMMAWNLKSRLAGFMTRAWNSEVRYDLKKVVSTVLKSHFSLVLAALSFSPLLSGWWATKAVTVFVTGSCA